MEGLCLDEDQRKAVSQNSNLHYPKLSDMLNYIIAQHPAVLHSTSVGETTLLFPSKSYIAMIKFLLKCFVAEEKEYDLPEDFEYPCSVDRFCLLLEHAMAYEGSVELHANASNALITIASSIPQVG